MLVEAHVFKEGVSLAKRCWHKRIVLQTDSEIIHTDLVKEGRLVQWKATPVLKDIKAWSRYFEGFKVGCVSRKANMAADLGS